MVGSNWLFAARLLPYIPDFETWLVRTSDSNRMSLWESDPSRVPVFAIYLGEPGEHFPGPYDVEPD